MKIVTAADGKVDPAASSGLGVGTEDDIENRRTRHDAELEHDHDDFDSFVVPLPEIAEPAALAARVAALADLHMCFASRDSPRSPASRCGSSSRRSAPG